MATAALIGNAEIEYEDPDGSTVVHILAAPLLVSPRWDFASTRRRRRWESWNATGTVREVFALAGAVDEISGTIRFENDPVGLRALLEAALEGNVPLTYRPTGPSGDYYDCILVAIAGVPTGEIVITPDRERHGFGEWEVTILLRRVDGGTFEGLL